MQNCKLMTGTLVYSMCGLCVGTSGPAQSADALALSLCGTAAVGTLM